jgi:hypothetical protein
MKEWILTVIFTISQPPHEFNMQLPNKDACLSAISKMRKRYSPKETKFICKPSAALVKGQE